MNENTDCDKCEYGIKRQLDTNETSFPDEFAHKRIHVRRDLHSNDDKTEVKSECIQNEIRCNDDNKSRSLDNDDKEVVDDKKDMKFVKIDPVITVQTEEMQVQSDCAKDHSNEVILIDSNVDVKPINTEVVPVADCRKSKSENYLNYNVQSFKPECNGRMFSCVHCEDVYVKEDRIKDHLGEVHGDYHYFCSNCGVYFKEHLEYRQHVYLFRHNCGYCPYGSNRRRTLELHCDRVHKDIIL